MQWKPKTNGIFFSKYINNLSKKNLEKEDLENLKNDTADVISKCINPSQTDSSNRLTSTNLVLGYIQSGKTTSMEAVSCMARDNGFKLIILLSGHVTNLAEQTQDRVYEALNMFGWKRIEVPGGGAKLNYEDINVALKDIVSSQEDDLFDDEEKQAVLIVTMKHHKRIDKIIQIFDKAKENGIDTSKLPTLIIDDEADHYSQDSLVRTRRRTFPENISPRMHTVEKDETIESIAEKYCVSEDTLRYLNSLEINDSLEKLVGSKLCIERAESTTHRRIKRLRQSLNKHTFLAYTATPMAQFLISTVNHLSPKSGTVLTPGKHYTGAQYFFGQGAKQQNKHTRIVEETETDDPSIMPNSLRKAIRLFILGVAIGIKEQDHTEGKSRSMLVHPSVGTTDHEKWKGWVDGVIRDDKKIFESKWANIKDPNSVIDISYKDLENDYLEAIQDLKKNGGKIPSWDNDFIKNVLKSLKLTVTTLFNAAGKSNIPFIKWGEDGIYSRILVGGVGLERGYTIQGLTVSFIVRKSGTDDTVYQRARFFGYHKDYVDFVRFYLPNDLIEFFQEQYDNEIIVRNKIKDAVKEGGDLRTDLKRIFPFSSKNGPVRRSIVEHNLTRRPKGFIAEDVMSHHLNDIEQDINKKIYDELINLKNKKNITEVCQHSYAKALRDMYVIEDLNLKETNEKYLKHIFKFDEDAKDDFDLFDELTEYNNNQNLDDLKLAIIIMNSSDDRRRGVDKTEFINGESRIPICSGGGKTRPHHRFLHYEFLTLPEQRWITSAKESFIPADGKEARRAENIATLQLFRFNIDDGDNTDKPFKKNIPYFRLYCPKVLGTRFMAKKL